jgi:hypothetical protein
MKKGSAARESEDPVSAVAARGAEGTDRGGGTRRPGLPDRGGLPGSP